ncbi:MAG: glycosyltransferase [Rhodospirillales bacterium]|nr:glycosyltransferase [Rhodospirillales bacterium]MDE2319234.1 glycosyltransferase [Rhodospirillales bacterium]
MIVFITDELPKPGAAGHLALNHAIISWLRNEGHNVTIMLVGMRLTVPLGRYELAPVTGPHVRSIGAYIMATPLAVGKIFSRKLFRCLPPVLAGTLRHPKDGSGAVLGKFPKLTEIRWLKQALEKLKPEAVLIDTIFRAPILADSELGWFSRILIAHDVFYRRVEALEAAGYHVQPEGLTRQQETRLLMHAAHIAAIQPEEAGLLREMCPQANVFTAPMPALPCPPAVGVKKLVGRLVFIGSDSLPNLDGLRWFFTEIWPLLRGHGVTLDLIGDCGPALRRLPPGVNILGRVPNLAPILHRAALAISPLRAGSGLKIKLLDYARHGLFTVATSPSLQGFHDDVEAPFIVAGSASMFAEAVLRHVAAPQPPHAAIAYVARYYSTENAFAGLRAALSTIKSQQKQTIKSAD